MEETNILFGINLIAQLKARQVYAYGRISNKDYDDEFDDNVVRSYDLEQVYISLFPECLHSFHNGRNKVVDLVYDEYICAYSLSLKYSIKDIGKKYFLSRPLKFNFQNEKQEFEYFCSSLLSDFIFHVNSDLSKDDKHEFLKLEELVK